MEMMMMVFALISIFISVIAGFGGLAAFMWSQFRKLHESIHDIRENYVKDSECRQRRQDCSCHNSIEDLKEQFEKRFNK
jgi:hypothetical protein